MGGTGEGKETRIETYGKARSYEADDKGLGVVDVRCRRN
jgi:hypothetical protein